MLGYQAAATLGIDRLDQPTCVAWGHWFTVVGILEPLPLAPEIDRSALVGFLGAARLLGYQGHPSRIYVRTATEQTTPWRACWPPPPTPSTPSRSRPAALGRADRRVAAKAPPPGCSSVWARCWWAGSASPTSW